MKILESILKAIVVDCNLSQLDKFAEDFGVSVSSNAIAAMIERGDHTHLQFCIKLFLGEAVADRIRVELPCLDAEQFEHDLTGSAIVCKYAGRVVNSWADLVRENRVRDFESVPADCEAFGRFVYQGYTFVPAGLFKKFGIKKGKTEFDQICRRLLEPSLLTKEQGYDWDEFYKAAGSRDSDVFYCIDNGNYYVPCAMWLPGFKV